MNIKNQRRLAAQVMDCSPYRVAFDQTKLSEIKEAITKTDIRALVREGVITANPVESNSQGRQRLRRIKKRRGQGKGQGRRKGARGARLSRKERWIATIRSQRRMLTELRENGHIENKVYRNLYLKSKGGFFRNKRHIKLYIEENKLSKNGKT
ncbi:MAG TPA: 50S ribosomal protein L19e [Candidatus Nanoarchaeia archaeon]|nr:50S ribosomal protein L19e [Candidatus Nanoarchaeia archaeon]